MWCWLHSLSLSLPYLPLSFRLPLPTFTSSRFFPTLYLRHGGFLTGLLSWPDKWPPAPLCQVDVSIRAQLRVSVGSLTSLGLNGVVGVHLGKGKRMMGYSGYLLRHLQLALWWQCRHDILKDPPKKMISQAPQYAFLCHQAHISRDNGVTHMIVQSSFLNNSCSQPHHCTPSVLQTCTVCLTRAKVPGARISCSLQAYIPVLTYRTDLTFNSFSLPVFQRN